MKRLSIDALAERLEECRRAGQRIVHCHGVFDLLHVGHIKHLQAARELGDVLVVTLTPDRYVNKGPHRPAFTESLRAEALAALACVDFVGINEWPTAVEVIGKLRPHLFVKGFVPDKGKRDFTDAIEREEEAVRAAGGKLHFTEEETFSASELINRYLDVFTPEASEFLRAFKQRHDEAAVLAHLESLKRLKVLVVGEIILDDYHFCNVLTKASKDPVLVSRHQYHETYAGGILAIANHVASLCGAVTVATALGTAEGQEDFIRGSLMENVRLDGLVLDDAPAITKQRFLEEYSGTKLFEVYRMRNEVLTPERNQAFREKLRELMPAHDLVIVADYGHGLIDEETIALLSAEAPFLALNVQTNAGNNGFNLVSKYPRADFVCIDKREAYLEVRNAEMEDPPLIEEVAGRLQAPRCLITTGKRGSIFRDPEGYFSRVPAFAIRLVDRIGAGDALLSVTAPLAFLGAPSEVIGFVGNLAGAQACAVMGNKRALDASGLQRSISSLLK